MEEVDDGFLQDIYAWIDKIPLSRPKRNLARDFSDGVMIAEVVSHYFPKYVELHNYIPATGTKAKMGNWLVLNRKVFKKLHFELTDEVIRQIIECKPLVMEKILMMLRSKIDHALLVRSPRQDADYSQPTDQSQQRDSSQSAGESSNKPNTNGRGRFAPEGSNGNGSTKQPGKSVSVDVVPLSELQAKIQELLNKQETVQILNEKIVKLEYLLQLKEMRIEELETKIREAKPPRKH